MSDPEIPSDEPTRADIRRIVASSSLGRQLRAARAKQQREHAALAPPPRRARRAGGALPDVAALQRRIDDLYAERGWRVFDFQHTVWAHLQQGRSGLLHAGTGSGKTLAVWLGALLRAAAQPAPGLRVLWITPMRALAADTALTLGDSARALGLDWDVGLRTGDTGSAERARQARALPQALVTTPESLTLMLSHETAREQLGALCAVVVDEWHELIANKRGVQAQLALARLRQWNPALPVWGLSATLGNPDHAMQVLCGPGGERVAGEIARPVKLDSLIPAHTERFPWAGHLGVKLLDAVLTELDGSPSTLLFTNTRSQAELWYQALLAARPDWAGLIALHHGSLSREVREWVEAGLKNGTLRAVVCTSSLDLGVDFLPVERVLQLGSPKGVARLMQRAGRSGHAPGRTPHATCVPGHGLELIDSAAARRAVAAGRIEPRHSPEAPVDVLVQHLVTLALAGGFDADALKAEIRTTHAYRALDDRTWDWAMDFVSRGGASLAAYPDYRKVERDADGRHRVPRVDIARRHRMQIGTITADSAVDVRWAKGGKSGGKSGGHDAPASGAAALAGGRLGQVEESFIGRLKPGDCFLFAGRVLELVAVRDMQALVRVGNAARGTVPRWAGGRMPLSSELAQEIRTLIALAAQGDFPEPEMQALRPLLDVQRGWSALPREDELLIEVMQSREGHHAFFFPFAGRPVHAGMAALLAGRISRSRPITFSLSFNDYGFELLSASPVDWATEIAAGLLSGDALEADIEHCLNAAQLARRRFREVARVAGLTFQGYPGQGKSARQLQVSSELLFDVFSRHDPDNLLLQQAKQEALVEELDADRIAVTLAAMRAARHCITHPPSMTPFAFPLLVARLRERLSSEQLSERVARMVALLEKAAGP
ncbi:ligase-associated DNA damage response DEXH box helicase [Methyloversatilis sp. RAC08]|uniref:ligase-associated DNA damage response DEXH box helicase n=1 Tax=Methyloversatilis sp. RAC08 TaxID=1842540 RepID=UPI00083E1428|nr:ligase-associated DNA damage response DEXH box helicase [Methyloversatilis sp. RAC08]